MTENKTIKIHNSIGEARYKLNLAEQKFFIYAIMQINQDDDNFENVEFKMTDFAKFVGLDISRMYKDIDRIIENVMGLVMTIKKSNNKWAKFNLTQKCEYEEGVIKFKFNQDMKPLLLRLRDHYFLQSPSVIKFRSWHSIRLYDLLKSVAYKQIKHNGGMFEYELEELKALLKLESKYNRFNSFREKVVDPAINEINGKADIKVSYEKITRGRKVTGIKFLIENTATKNKSLINQLYSKEQLEEIRIKSGIEENYTIEQVAELYEIAVRKTTSANIDPFEYIKLNHYGMMKKDTARNKFAYLKKAIEEDYAKAIAQISTGYIVE